MRIKEHAEPFPHPGANNNDPAPLFAKKKDAKKYAAKCAVEWLRAHEYMPKTGGVKFPKSPPPHPTPAATTSKQTRRQPSAAASSSVAFASRSPAGPLTPSAATPRADSEMDGDGNSASETDEPPAHFKVNQLCNELYIRPPQYDLTRDPQHKVS